MGASGWSYFTPYDPDVERALQRLRQQVFESCRYGKAERLDPRPEDLAHVAPETRPAVEPRSKEFEAALAELRTFEAQRIGGGPRRFASIDKLMEAAGEDGTHSVLDIWKTAPEAGFGLAAPADPDLVQRTLGTQRPTHAVVAAHAGELAEMLERWHAVYIVVYADEKPVEYFFEGVSGD